MMRGYVYFTVAFASCALLITLLHLFAASQAQDDSLAISIERAYCTGMDARAAVIESARQGASEGFSLYDETHSASDCRHCEDHFCEPPLPGVPPGANACEKTLCLMCFRESGARRAAEAAGESAIAKLRPHVFDSDFTVSINGGPLSARLAPDPLSANGFRLAAIAIPSDIRIIVSSSRFGIASDPAIPGGTVIPYESPGID